MYQKNSNFKNRTPLRNVFSTSTSPRASQVSCARARAHTHTHTHTHTHAHAHTCKTFFRIKYTQEKNTGEYKQRGTPVFWLWRRNFHYHFGSESSNAGLRNAFVSSVREWHKTNHVNYSHDMRNCTNNIANSGVLAYFSSISGNAHKAFRRGKNRWDRKCLSLTYPQISLP